MGEILNTALVSAFDIDWVSRFREPAWAVPIGLAFGLYGLRKLLWSLGERSDFGEFPFNRSQGISCAYYGALNASIFVFIGFLFLEAGTEIGFAIGAVNPRIRHYAEAAFVFSTLAAIIAIGLVLWVYIGIAARKDLADRPAKLSYLHDSLQKRGFGHIDLFGVPAIALIFNLGPWALRFLV